MKHTKLFESFINEGFILDAIDNEPLFQEEEFITLSKFLAICRKSAEGKKAIKYNSNFGKGIQMAENLKKNSKLPFQARVYRTAWNYGENLVVIITLKGDDRRDFFEFNSQNSTRSPQYTFGKVFTGTRTQDNDTFEIGSMYGSYKSISNYKEVMLDVLHIFNDFERVNGSPFDLKSAVKIQKAKAKVRSEWSKVEDKLDKVYYEAKDLARKVSRDITMRIPTLKDNNTVVFFKHSEPRELRHPDEYGERAEKMMSSKEYDKYERTIGKVVDIAQKFADKHKLEFVWGANYN